MQITILSKFGTKRYKNRIAHYVRPLEGRTGEKAVVTARKLTRTCNVGPSIF